MLINVRGIPLCATGLPNETEKVIQLERREQVEQEVKVFRHPEPCGIYKCAGNQVCGCAVMCTAALSGIGNQVCGCAVMCTSALSGIGLHTFSSFADLGIRCAYQSILGNLDVGLGHQVCQLICECIMLRKHHSHCINFFVSINASCSACNCISTYQSPFATIALPSTCAADTHS